MTIDRGPKVETHGQRAIFAHIFSQCTAAGVLHEDVDSVSGSHDVVAVNDVLVFDLRENGQFAFEVGVQVLFVWIQLDHLDRNDFAVLLCLVHRTESAAVQLLHEQIAVYVEIVFLVCFGKRIFFLKRCVRQDRELDLTRFSR